MSKFTTMEKVTWTSRTVAGFGGMVAEVEARLGPPSVRDLDSNGLGPFDAHMLRFPCGLEVALWRFHCGTQMETLDPLVEPCWYEVYSSRAGDLDHIAFHIEMAVERLETTTDEPRVRVAPSFIVMRTDDNGNDVEVMRVTSRCEAEAVVEQYERRGHKQSYWIAEAVLGGASGRHGEALV